MNRTEFENTAKELYERPGGTAGICLLELKSGETFEHNADWVMDHPASTIKLGILCAALYKAQEGLVSLEDRLVCLKEDKVPGSGVLQHLRDGTVLPLIDMLMLMVIQSDNSATNITMEYIGIDYINAFFDKCGLPDIRLRRKLYDMDGIKKGIRNNISARSLARLLYDLEKRAFLSDEFASIGLDILSKQQISNTLQKYITIYYDKTGNWFNYPIKLGTKSGSDDTVKHDCGIIYTPKSTIIIGALTKNMYTPDAEELIGRFAELAVLYFDPESLVKTYKQD